LSSSPDALLRALKTCLLKTDYVQKHERRPYNCLKCHTNERPQPCQNLRKTTSGTWSVLLPAAPTA
ncbi:hypothetical protein PISMIDRAFT_93826, partial [Pisolithus microcarpus 441]